MMHGSLKVGLGGIVCRRRARALGVVLLLIMVAAFVADTASGITIQFDYTYDSYGFFDDPLRREVLELAAGEINRFIDHLDPITPSGVNEWTIRIPQPDHPDHVLVEGVSVPVDTMIVYVGARDHSAGTLALASIGTIWSASGTPEWLETVRYRGQSGAAADPPTDYAARIGTIAFNKTADWYFGMTTDGMAANDIDFLTVATHELIHVLGFGPSESFQGLVVDDHFTGAESLAVGSSNNPSLQLDGAHGHWADDTQATFDGVPQMALMSPTMLRNNRRYPTDLDRAALRDFGWQEALPGDANLDRSIDSNDIQMLLGANTFPNQQMAVWATGDFTGDMRCDSDDIQAILGTGMFAEGPYASSLVDADTIAAEEALGVVSLILTPDGLAIENHGAPLSGYLLISDLGIFSGDSANNLGFFQEDTDERIGGGYAMTLSGVYALGDVIGDEFATMSVDAMLDDLTLTYTLEGRPGIYRARILVPEPSTLAMLLAMPLVGALGLLARRRCR